MKILCDQMLGSLASWLRFMGVDTFFTSDQLSDKEILQIAIDEQRTLITRDKELIIRAKKHHIPHIAITSINLDDQIRVVISSIDLDEKKILTRCSLCNSVLSTIEKRCVSEYVPLRVYQQQTLFWKCSTCGKIYWRGSHYRKIVEKIKSFKS